MGNWAVSHQSTQSKHRTNPKVTQAKLRLTLLLIWKRASSWNFGTQKQKRSRTPNMVATVWELYHICCSNPQPIALHNCASSVKHPLRITPALSVSNHAYSRVCRLLEFMIFQQACMFCQGQMSDNHMNLFNFCTEDKFAQFV